MEQNLQWLVNKALENGKWKIKVGYKLSSKKAKCEKQV